MDECPQSCWMMNSLTISPAASGASSHEASTEYWYSQYIAAHTAINGTIVMMISKIARRASVWR